MSTLTERLERGVVAENPAAVQLLGLCPLLAVSHSLVNALGLAAATLFVLAGSNAFIALARPLVPDVARLPAFMLVIAGFTTVAVRAMEAFAFDLYVAVALFVQIIATNCVILSRAERAASRASVRDAIADGLSMGLGFGVALVALGAAREIVGHGTLGAGLERLFGDAARELHLVVADGGMLVAVLPPGAFVLAGLLLALVNALRMGSR